MSVLNFVTITVQYSNILLDWLHYTQVCIIIIITRIICATIIITCIIMLLLIISIIIIINFFNINCNPKCTITRKNVWRKNPGAKNGSSGPAFQFDSEPDPTVWYGSGSGSLSFQRGNVPKTVLFYIFTWFSLSVGPKGPNQKAYFVKFPFQLILLWSLE